MPDKKFNREQEKKERSIFVVKKRIANLIGKLSELDDLKKETTAELEIALQRNRELTAEIQSENKE